VITPRLFESRLAVIQKKKSIKIKAVFFKCSTPVPLISEQPIRITLVIREENKFWRANLSGESRELQSSAPLGSSSVVGATGRQWNKCAVMSGDWSLQDYHRFAARQIKGTH